MAAGAFSISPAVSFLPLRGSSTEFFKARLSISFHPQRPRPHVSVLTGPPSSSRVFAAPELTASKGAIDSSGLATEAAEGSALEVGGEEDAGPSTIAVGDNADAENFRGLLSHCMSFKCATKKIKIPSNVI